MDQRFPTVLFVCVHNAGRSQMAAGFLEELGAGRVIVRSAGTEPADHIHSVVVHAMREVGIDLVEKLPNALSDEVVKEADVVVTMGCGDACPVYAGKRYEEWDFPDPSDRPLEEVREIRDEIHERVVELLDQVTTPSAW